MDVTITDHAILRWLERAKGIDVEGIKQQMRQDGFGERKLRNDSRVLKYIVDKTGLNIGLVKQAMLTPIVITALSVGARYVKHQDYRFALGRNRIITVLETEMNIGL